MSDIRQYDAILIGTGSGLQVIDAFMKKNPEARVAVIDHDRPGGICLTRGCIPSKILLYSAEVVRILERAPEFGISAGPITISFPVVMDRMRQLIGQDIDQIESGLRKTPRLDYYTEIAEFVDIKTLKAGESVIRSDLIFLCTGSRPAIPLVTGLEESGYLTSDTILSLEELPKSTAVIGGGYIAAEYGHFLAAMGSSVTIIGRNPQFIPEAEPEVSACAREELERHLTILTNHEVREVRKDGSGRKILTVIDRGTMKAIEVAADEVLVASGRVSNTDLLHPERSGVRTDERGWIIVDKNRQTSQPGIWAFGDATGLHPFKHHANLEARVVYYNAVLGEKREMDDNFVPSAVFTDPEIASVGLKEKDAISSLGEENVLIGFALYEDTARGIAMAAGKSFAKIVIEASTGRIVGAHLVGPQASALIQEILTLMQADKDATAGQIGDSMHIHPSLGEVVEYACSSPMTLDMYHHLLRDHLGFEKDERIPME